MTINSIREDSQPRFYSVSTSKKRTTYFRRYTRGFAIITQGAVPSNKALRQGYFWLMMKTDTMNLTRKCDKCQRFFSIPRSHPEKLTSMTSPWLLTIWGIDLIGPMPAARLTLKYAVVVVGDFTKWAEAKPLAMISSKKVQEFVWESIICPFGLPHKIISDNGMQFDRNKFCTFCNDFGIKKSFSSVDHPQSNDQVEAVNKIIKFNLKTKLEEHKGLWAKELLKVLWAYRMTSWTSTGETPFSLACGVEAMIPIEIGVPSLRRETYNQEKNFAL